MSNAWSFLKRKIDEVQKKPQQQQFAEEIPDKQEPHAEEKQYTINDSAI
jgi:hypothetical protein